MGLSIKVYRVHRPLGASATDTAVGVLHDLDSNEVMVTSDGRALGADEVVSLINILADVVTEMRKIERGY